MNICKHCGKTFKSAKARNDHFNAKHRNPLAGIPRKERAQIVADIGADMSDGAFWALAESMGVEPEDFMPDAERQKASGE